MCEGVGMSNEAFEFAFLPWAMLPSPATVGAFGFRPIQNDSKEFFDLPKLVQQTLSSHVSFSGGPRRGWTLVERCGMAFQPGDNGAWSNYWRTDCAHACEVLALATIARNEPYMPASRYVNSAVFEPIVQRVSGSLDHVGYLARQKYGAVRVLSSAKVSRPEPLHCHAIQVHEPDRRLISALSSLVFSGVAPTKRTREIMAACNLFTASHTDSPSVVAEDELVGQIIALNILLGRENKQKTADRLDSLFALDTIKYALTASARRSQVALTDRDPRRPSETLLWNWYIDAYCVRNDWHHERTLRQSHYLWTVEEHLHFSAQIFPLALKFLLAEMGLYGLTESDHAMAYSLMPLLDVRDWWEPDSDRPNLPKWTKIVARGSSDILWRKLVTENLNL